MLAVSLLVCAMMALARASDEELLVLNLPNDTVSLMEVKVQGAACPGGWSKLGDRCFYHETSKKTWAQAQQNCQSRGGNLASIQSANEYNHLQQKSTEVAWIGASDCQETNAWFWIDGTPFNYNFWCPAQPDNTLEQCCVQMNTGDSNCWDDVACNSLHPSFCVKSP